MCFISTFANSIHTFSWYLHCSERSFVHMTHTASLHYVLSMIAYIPDSRCYYLLLSCIVPFAALRIRMFILTCLPALYFSKLFCITTTLFYFQNQWCVCVCVCVCARCIVGALFTHVSCSNECRVIQCMCVYHHLLRSYQ